MRSDNLQLPCIHPPSSLCTTSNFLVCNRHFTHGCHGHHGHQCHGGHGDHVGHGGRGEPGGRDGTGRICNVNTGDVTIDFIISTMSKYMKSVLPINWFKQCHPTSGRDGMGRDRTGRD